MEEKLSNYIDKARERGEVIVVRPTREQVQKFNEEMQRVRRESILKQVRSEMSAAKVILNS